MVRLICVVVGVGHVFCVHVELSDWVDQLKDKIKEKKSNLVYYEADLLKLYLAREGDTWLSTRDPDFKALKAGALPARIENLMQEHLLLEEGTMLGDDDCLSKDFQPGYREIHVLVECPDEAAQFYPYKSKCIRHSAHDYSFTILTQR